MTKRWKIAGATIVALALALVGTMTVAARGPARGGLDWQAWGNQPPANEQHGGRLMAPYASEAVAEALGLTEDELRSQLRDGATLADLAEAKGVALADLRDIAENERASNILERIGQAVENGRLSQAFRDWFSRGVDEGFVLNRGDDRADSVAATAAAQALGMTPEEVELQLWGGRSLADLAANAGVELTAVQSAIEAARKAEAIERIEQAVENGNLTRERADWLIEGVEEGFPGPGRLGPLGGGAGPMPFGLGRPGMGRR